MISRPPVPNHVRGSWASLELTEITDQRLYPSAISVWDIFSYLFFISRPLRSSSQRTQRGVPYFSSNRGGTDSMKALSVVSASRLQILYFAEDMRLMENRISPRFSINIYLPQLPLYLCELCERHSFIWLRLRRAAFSIALRWTWFWNRRIEQPNSTIKSTLFSKNSIQFGQQWLFMVLLPIEVIPVVITPISNGSSENNFETWVMW